MFQVGLLSKSLLTLEFQVASIKHKNNNKQTSRKQKEETPPAPVVEEDTKEEKAKLVSGIIYSFISSEIVRTLLHICRLHTCKIYTWPGLGKKKSFWPPEVHFSSELKSEIHCNPPNWHTLSPISKSKTNFETVQGHKKRF